MWYKKSNEFRDKVLRPSLKPCSVRLTMLSPEAISSWSKRQKSVGTNTPEGFCKIKTPICLCQKIPLIVLDDESSSKYINKSTSTSCTCNGLKSQSTFTTQALKLQNQTKHLYQKQPISDTLLRPRYRNGQDNMIQGIDGSNMFSTSFSTYSDFKESQNSVLHNTLHLSNSSFDFKTALSRRPLAVVPPTTVAVTKEILNLTLDQSLKILPQYKSIPLIKINFSRSVLDAIKWYTKDDTSVDANDSYLLKEEIFKVYDDRSQENIKPIHKITLPIAYKPINYFDIFVNNHERDFCFERSDGTSKLITRRGGRHYVNREPCPSCFQGRDNFCVYEFIRQAKLAGITLQTNKKLLQTIFFKFIQAEKNKA